MTNEAQAVYDAAFRQFDISWVTQQAHSAITDIQYEITRPSVLFRPKVSIDGSYYCVLYGDDLMSGCSGFGKTLSLAMRDFDKNWESQQCPKAAAIDSMEATPPAEPAVEKCSYCSGPLDEPDGQACSRCLAAVLADAKESPSAEPVVLPESLDCSTLPDVESVLAEALDVIDMFVNSTDPIVLGVAHSKGRALL